MKNKITQLFEDVGKDYETRKLITFFDIHQGHDVHVFYRLPRNIENVVHVQGYPEMSTEFEARVFARSMDYNKMMAVRKAGMVSIGNEHYTVVSTFPNFENGVMIPYESYTLEGLIGENIPELLPEETLNLNFGEPELKGEEIFPKDKWTLRDYLKTIDLRDTKQLRKRSFEIVENVRRVMNPYVIGKRGSGLKNYYAEAVKLMENAHKRRDFKKSFPEALEFMIGSVDWE